MAKDRSVVAKSNIGDTPSEGLRRPTLFKADVSRLGSQFLAPLIVELRRCIVDDRLAVAEPGSIE